jgi:CRISPR-associated protein Cas2
MMTKINNYIIAYDICDDKRLARVRKLIYSYALGGQKSALEVPLSKNEIKIVIDKILSLTKKEDKVNIIPFEGKPALFGKANFVEYHQGVIIV